MSAPLILTIRARTVNGRANEIRHHANTIALAREQGRRVIFRIKVKGVRR